MLAFVRRFMVALLAAALTFQLAQGQLLLCGEMDMRGESMPGAAMAAGHEVHESPAGTAIGTGDTAQPGSTDASACTLAASCVNAAADLMPVQWASGAVSGATVPPSLESSPHLRASRPDLPPPRV